MQSFYLSTQKSLIMKVSTPQITVFSCCYYTLALNTDTARSTNDLTFHVIVIRYTRYSHISFFANLLNKTPFQK